MYISVNLFFQIEVFHFLFSSFLLSFGFNGCPFMMTKKSVGLLKMFGPMEQFYIV